MRGRRRTLVLAGVAGSAGLSVVLAVAAGAPDRLPAVAMASLAVLYIERAAVVFVGLVTALSVLIRAFDGELPIEFGARGLRYDVVAATQRESAAHDELGSAVEEFGRSVEEVLDVQRKLARRIDRLDQQQGQ